MPTVELVCPNCHLHLEGFLSRDCSRCGYQLKLSQGYWQNTALLPPYGFSQSQRNHLRDIETRHFWFAPRDRLLVKIAEHELAGDGNTLEIGGGSGRLLREWGKLFRSVTMAESHAQSLQEAAARQSQATLVQADVSRLPFKYEQFDTLLAFDVLEHVAADDLLAEARRVARDGARFLISVPACQSLWSYADELAGHRCRYDLTKINDELTRNGWRLIGYTHYQYLLFPILYFSRRILREYGRRAERHPFNMLNKLLGAINAFEVACLSRFSLPVGSSLIVWAEAI